MIVFACFGRSFTNSSGTEEMVMEKAVERIDSIMTAQDTEPEKYAEFKKSVKDLTIPELTQECFRYVLLKDSEKEFMYYRIIVGNYSRKLDLIDKQRVLSMLSNLGYVYSTQKNDLPNAYIILKTAYEVSRKSDPTHSVESALLVNLAHIYELYNDLDNAERLYREAFKLAFSDEFKPREERARQLARIHANIEWIHFMWVNDEIDSTKAYRERFLREVPNSAYEFFPYSRYLSLAAEKYQNKDYKGSALFLDSAYKALQARIPEQSYSAICKLLEADAYLRIPDYAMMKQSLDETEAIIKNESLSLIYPAFYKGLSSYYRHTGDSLRAKK